MKKTLLLGMALMGALAANAQITNGANAPEISGDRVISVNNDTDVVTYGEEISLQAYLDAGKTVIMDGSATWCGPCWSFHNSKTLDNMYAAYGPEGSDELRVLFVEADPGTAVSELGGEDKPVLLGLQERGVPQGNWLTDVAYPVINNDNMTKSVANGGYGLNAFPTLYIIVPSGTVGQPGKVYNYSLTDFDKSRLVKAINTARGTDLVGIDHWGSIIAGGGKFCDAGVPVTARVQGFGHAVTSVEAQLKKDGAVVSTQTFEGLDLDAFETGEITFEGYTSEPGVTYQAVLTKLNDADALNTIPENNISEEYDYITGTPLESADNIKIVIHTDEYPAEMKLYILRNNPQGTYSQADIAYQTPNYSNTATYKEKTFTYTKQLDSNECYTILLSDGNGDGWDWNEVGEAPQHGVTITSGSTVLFQHNGTFTFEVLNDTAFKTNGTLGNETFEALSSVVFPNPSTGIFNFAIEEVVDVTVVDLTGKTVHTAKGIENGGSINLSGLQKGMYIAKISGASGERNEKLIIK